MMLQLLLVLQSVSTLDSAPDNGATKTPPSLESFANAKTPKLGPSSLNPESKQTCELPSRFQKQSLRASLYLYFQSNLSI